MAGKSVCIGLLRGALLVGLALVLQALVPSTGSASVRPYVVSTSVQEEGGVITVTVPGTTTSPGYGIRIARDPFQITTVRGGKTVLATTSGGAARFSVLGTAHRAVRVTSWSWEPTTSTLTMAAATSLPGSTVQYRLVPSADRYKAAWSVTGTGSVTSAGVFYNLASAGSWYGHGEAALITAPWPLNSGSFRDSMFGPASLKMVDPFWYSSSSTGLWVNVRSELLMDVAINHGGDGLGRFLIKNSDAFESTVFVERTPRAVYDDYVGIVGKPSKSDATYEQYQKPLWNTWAQFYTTATQAGTLDYAEKLAAQRLAGHTIQVDGGWEAHRGDLTFHGGKFPDPKAMSARIHQLGFDFGLWVSLFVNTDSVNYEYARSKGYLLADAADPSVPCSVQWWADTGPQGAGLIDLGNPDALQWYKGQLNALRVNYAVDGFKFDTRFFAEHCAPRAPYRPLDYLTLGAQLADEYDLQGAGIRIHWSPAAHRFGFVTRQNDKGTDWLALQTAIKQSFAISSIGYPFVETDMIGGSLMEPPPEKAVLIRWAQAASLMPLMYSSTSPMGVTHPTSGETNLYDQQTIDLYRAAIEQHRLLAPYIWGQVQETLATGEPLMKPLFFEFPAEQATYTINDQWLLGDAVMAAPILSSATSRHIYLPAGTWYDAHRRIFRQGPTTLRDYQAPLNVVPTFVRNGLPESSRALRAFDTVSPVAKAPRQSLSLSSTLGSSAVPVAITWSASDIGTGVARYQLLRSTDGSLFSTVALPVATTTSLTQLLMPNKSYQYRLRAQDRAGNWSSWVQGPTFNVNTLQEFAREIAYAGSWTRAPVSSAYGGYLSFATASGARASLTFTGRNIAWVAPRQNNRGKAEVWLNGVRVATVDLYSSAPLARRVVFSRGGLDPARSYKLEVRVLGTRNTAASGTRIDVDTFVVLR